VGKHDALEGWCEALRCLGQGLHTLEDFAAHTNYVELALREMGFICLSHHGMEEIDHTKCSRDKWENTTPLKVDLGGSEDLCEALRCLGQGLHTLEDFAAHTNYVELALREMGRHWCRSVRSGYCG
jgi:hypothetical protein